MKSLLALATAALALTPVSTAHAATLGTTAVRSSVATSAKGSARAFRFTARSTGRVNRLNVYVDGASTASRVEVGLYSGSASSVGAGRGRCVISRPEAGAWNRCSISSRTIKARRYYWLAVLQPSRASGRLRYRAGRRSGGRAISLRTRSTLPRNWTINTRPRRGSSASIYANLAARRTPTPTPTPTPGPSEWPDAANTGVPAGTTLTPGGNLTVSQAGAVIDAREITGNIVVNAPNVTIRRTRIRSNGFRAIENNSTGLLVEDTEIINRPTSGQPNCHNGIGWGNFTLRRTEITGCENAADIGDGNALLEDNYFHDLDVTGPSYVWGNTPHTDGIQAAGDNVTIRHNYIDPVPTGGGVTSGIIMDTSTSPNANFRIENNYIDGRGASYAIYAPRHQTTGVIINANRLLKGYGYTACVRLGITVADYTDNRDATTNQLLTPDNGNDGGCTN